MQCQRTGFDCTYPNCFCEAPRSAALQQERAFKETRLVCEATCKDGTPCTLPAFTKHERRWLCLLHHENAIKKANKYRDLLYAPWHQVGDDAT